MTEHRPRPGRHTTGTTIIRAIRNILLSLLTAGRPIPPCGAPDTDQKDLT